MNGAAPAPILALVTHARHVPAVERERIAERLRRELIGRSLILETCHRVEAYAMGAGDAERIALAQSLPTGGRMLAGEHAVRHAITVAVGEDSVVVGEDQILHQLRVPLTQPALRAVSIPRSSGSSRLRCRRDVAQGLGGRDPVARSRTPRSRRSSGNAAHFAVVLSSSSEPAGWVA